VKGDQFTESLIPDPTQTFKVDLIFCIFEEIFFSCHSPYQRSLIGCSTFGDLINLILDGLDQLFRLPFIGSELTFVNKPFSYRSLSSGRVASS